MTEEKDTPIESLSYDKVVDIGDLRVASGRTRRPFSVCRHLNVVYDTQERRIWCKDCERDIEPFDAYVALVRSYERAITQLDAERENIETAKAFTPRQRATKALDEAWRKRNTQPACPHCRKELNAKDFANGDFPKIWKDE